MSTRRTFIKSVVAVSALALVPLPAHALIEEGPPFPFWSEFLQDDKLYCFSCWATSPVTVELGPGELKPDGHRVWKFNPPLWVESVPEKKCGKWWFSKIIGSGKDMKTVTIKFNSNAESEEVQFYGGTLEEELGENLAILAKMPRNNTITTRIY